MAAMCRKSSGSGKCSGTAVGGFTLLELMIVLVVVAIGLALAVPTYRTFVDKRQLTSAAEQVSSFLAFAQSEAVKRNEQVTVSWHSPGGHNRDWCMGAVLDDDACDCRETDPAENDFCEIDDVPYRLVQTDFTDIDYELMHMNPAIGNFAFDPVRGVITDISSTEIIDDDWLFYVHSDEGSGSSRDYELEIRLNVTGRVRICTDPYRKKIIGGYPTC